MSVRAKPGRMRTSWPLRGWPGPSHRAKLCRGCEFAMPSHQMSPCLWPGVTWCLPAMSREHPDFSPHEVMKETTFRKDTEENAVFWHSCDTVLSRLCFKGHGCHAKWISTFPKCSWTPWIHEKWCPWDTHTHLLRFRRSVFSDKTLRVQTNSFFRIKP